MNLIPKQNHRASKTESVTIIVYKVSSETINQHTAKTKKIKSKGKRFTKNINLNSKNEKSFITIDRIMNQSYGEEINSFITSKQNENLNPDICKSTNEEENKSSSCSSCCKSLSSSKFFKMISRKRVILKKFVDGKFQPVILGAILINTLSMAIEHHEQVNDYNKNINSY